MQFLLTIFRVTLGYFLSNKNLICLIVSLNLNVSWKTFYLAKLNNYKLMGVENTPPILLIGFSLHMEFYIGSHALIHPNKMGLPKGSIDMSLRQV